LKLLVAGGAGFIGSNFVRHALTRWPGSSITVFDKLTYAGNLENLEGVLDDPRVTFVQGDICSPSSVSAAVPRHSHIINFAAESHVDRSILEPDAFVKTDIEGTRILLEAAKGANVERYLQVSTDEVYGHIPAPQRINEDGPLRPRSPYAASKAGGDLLVNAYHATYNVPTLVTRGANTYGPYQYPEKLIPLFITNCLEHLPLPVYGDGMQARDWLFVKDHCNGIGTVLERGQLGETYNLGASHEWLNRDVVDAILERSGADPSLVRHVHDRPGHDRRYALDTSKARALGWTIETTFEDGLAQTVDWYEDHRDWWKRIKEGSFKDFYAAQYDRRLAESLP